MKPLIKILAAAVVLGSVLTLAGCGGSQPDARVTTNANWNVTTSSKVEGNSESFWRNNKEVATYGFRHLELTDNDYNPSYYVAYDTANATYRTEFYMEDWDWSAENIPEGYAALPEGVTRDNKEPVYVYETFLSVSGVYALRADESYRLEFDDSIYSVCKFRMSGDNLQPVYSRQEVKNTTPSALDARIPQGKTVEQVMENVCESVNSTYETFYNRTFTEAKIFTDNKNEPEEGIKADTLSLESKEGYSVFDPAQLRAAIRAFAKNTPASRIFNVAVPQSHTLQSCTATIGQSTELRYDENAPGSEENQIIEALRDCPDYVYFDGTTAGGAVRYPRYNAVTLSLNAKLKGSISEQWYAAVENASMNTTRGVLLKMVDVMPFNLGINSYYLKKLELVKR